MHKISIPKGAEAVVLGFRHENYEAYIVGGCVRDSLLGKEPKDWDTPSTLRVSLRSVQRLSCARKTTFCTTATTSLSIQTSGFLCLRNAPFKRSSASVPFLMRNAPVEVLPISIWNLISPMLIWRGRC